MELEDDMLMVELLKDGAPVNMAVGGSGWTPLIYFVVRDMYDEVLLAIESGANVNQAEADGWTPLMFAANNGFSAVAMLLLESDADLHATSASTGAAALELARAAGHDGVVALLLERGATDSPLLEEMEQEMEEEVREGDWEGGEEGREEEREEGEEEVAAAPSQVEEEPSEPGWPGVNEPVENYPTELKVVHDAMQKDFEKHKKRKGLFFW
jgi:hypothetical protein